MNLKLLHLVFLEPIAYLSIIVAKSKEEPVDDERAILRKMRRMTDYYDIYKEIGR